MSTPDELRAALAVAELEERLPGSKDDPELKAELRYARWVARGGPEQEQARLNAGQDHTNRAVAEMYKRWKG